MLLNLIRWAFKFSSSSSSFGNEEKQPLLPDIGKSPHMGLLLQLVEYLPGHWLLLNITLRAGDGGRTELFFLRVDKFL